MAQEGNIPLGDIGGAKVTSTMEYRAPEEVLPVGDNTNNNIMLLISSLLLSS